MKKMSLFVVVLLIGAFFTISLADNSSDKSKKYDLKYNLSKGTKFTVTFIDKFERSSIMPNGDVTGNTIDDTYGGVFEVISADNDGLVLDLNITKAARLSKNPGGTFNSTFDEIIGKKVRFNMSETGELSNLDGFINLEDTNKILRRTAPDDLLHRLAALFPVLPGKSVELGDTWTSEITGKKPTYSGLKSDIKCKYTYKILGEEKIAGFDCLKIDVNYEQATKTDGEIRGRLFKYNMGGTGKETIYFAYKKGMFISKKGEYRPEGGMEGGPDFSDTIEYEVTVKF